jgi:hypothetical protein
LAKCCFGKSPCLYCFGEPQFGELPFGKPPFGKPAFGELAGPPTIIYVCLNLTKYVSIKKYLSKKNTRVYLLCCCVVNFNCADVVNRDWTQLVCSSLLILQQDLCSLYVVQPLHEKKWNEFSAYVDIAISTD